MNSLTIYLLCHNRPDDTRLAIKSILMQSDADFNLVVSDNSSDNRVENLMRIEFPDIIYIRRVPMLPALMHFNCCISEVTSDYFCLFHDDDLLKISYISEMKKQINKYANAVAFGCNSYIEKHGVRSSSLFFRSFQDVEKIKSPRALARRYYARSQSGVAAFSGYIYNKKLLGNQQLFTDGGKYGDTTWLIELAKKSYIVWLKQPLMIYRLHDSNDSNSESRGDRLSVLAYLKKNKSIIGEDTIADYRCSFIYKVAVNEKRQIFATRQKIANLFLKRYRWARYVRFSTYAALARRGLVKLLG